MTETPYSLRLYLAPELYLAFQRFQVDNELSRSHAGLLIFLHGLKDLEKVSPEVFGKFEKRYMVKLIKPEMVIPTLKEKTKAENDQDFVRLLGKVKAQWSTVNSKSRKNWLERAKSRPDLPGAVDFVFWVLNQDSSV